MPFQEWIAGLLQAGNFVFVVWAAVTIGLVFFGLFLIAVIIRFFVFVWNWLLSQEVQLKLRQMQFEGQPPEDIRLAAGRIAEAEHRRWKTLLNALFFTPFLMGLIAGFLVAREPIGAWVLIIIFIAYWLYSLFLILYS